MAQGLQGLLHSAEAVVAIPKVRVNPTINIIFFIIGSLLYFDFRVSLNK